MMHISKIAATVEQDAADETVTQESKDEVYDH
jgi:hypothetical protein